jgi:ankyrin repeat protein
MKYCILLLLFTSLSVSAQQISPNVALFGAASGNDIESMKRALADGADINSTPFGGGGRTPLIVAALLRRTEAVRFLIANKADVNKRDAGGETALFYAAGSSPEILIALVKAGADVNVKDEMGRTALMNETNPKMRKFLKDAGAKEIRWVNPLDTPPKPVSAPSASQTP